MVRIATPPKRLFRSRRQAKAAMDAAIGPIPPGIERLRRARSAIDPKAVYRLERPGGEVIKFTGSELLATADAFLAIADAHEAGDEAALRRATLPFALLGWNRDC